MSSCFFSIHTNSDKTTTPLLPREHEGEVKGKGNGEGPSRRTPSLANRTEEPHPLGHHSHHGGGDYELRLTKKADVWAVGTIAFYLVFQRSLFECSRAEKRNLKETELDHLKVSCLLLFGADININCS
jgi:hypothetical protein